MDGNPFYKMAFKKMLPQPGSTISMISLQVRLLMFSIFVYIITFN
jgi:hypothetical protein